MLQDIREIIYGFASENRIYSNEAQFQHDLAISLEKLGYNVYLGSTLRCKDSGEPIKVEPIE